MNFSVGGVQKVLLAATSVLWRENGWFGVKCWTPKSDEILPCLRCWHWGPCTDPDQQGDMSMKKKQMYVDFHAYLSGVTHMRQDLMVWQIKSHFSIVCRFYLFSLNLILQLLVFLTNYSPTIENGGHNHPSSMAGAHNLRLGL